jgi:hypothetical protein
MDHSHHEAQSGQSRAKPYFEGKLTKEKLKELPEGGILQSNTTHDDASPQFEGILGPKETREELWAQLRKEGLTGTKFRLFMDGESYDAFRDECDQALMRHSVKGKWIIPNNETWKIMPHDSSVVSETRSKVNTFDIWREEPQLLLASDLSWTSITRTLDKLISKHGSPERINCYDTYLLEARIVKAWAHYRGVCLLLVP